MPAELPAVLKKDSKILITVLNATQHLQANIIYGNIQSKNTLSPERKVAKIKHEQVKEKQVDKINVEEKNPAYGIH